MDRFLVQVNRDGGFTNITRNLRYENVRWKNKSRDVAHGEVKPGDELLIYCTSNVPRVGQSIAFVVQVRHVSSDRVSFELDHLLDVPFPLPLQRIRELMNQGILPGVFYNCGLQGFNITKLDQDAVNRLYPLIFGGQPSEHYLEPDSPVSSSIESEDAQEYTVGNIIEEGCFIDEDRLSSILESLKNKKNLILQGPPGTGKTWLAKKLAFAHIGRKVKHQLRSFQFHPNMSYEDFVRGWRPTGKATLELVDGPFLKAVGDAKCDSSNDYVVVIEEINRGNPAQIFGEMLTLLEADKREPDEALALTYSTDSEEPVYIPSNLYVIGTMNVADRSLALVDLALRRRFAFIDLEPVFGERWRSWVRDNHSSLEEAFLLQVEERLTSLNRAIAEDATLGPQFRVGHSVVTPNSTILIEDPIGWFTQVVETEIGPLLGEYWFDDVDRARDEKARLLQGLTT